LKKNAATHVEISNAIDKNLSSFNQSFNGVRQNANYAFVLARGETGAELVKVRKQDGKEVANIKLDSNKPLYEIDPTNNNLYYAAGKELKLYTEL